MGATFPYLLFLYSIFTTVEANVTQADDCGEQLLIAPDTHPGEGLMKLCPATNETQTVVDGRERFRLISYSPRDGGTIAAYQESKLITFVHTNALSTMSTPHAVMGIENTPKPCREARSSAWLRDMAIDWVTGVIYAVHMECDGIQVYDLKGQVFSTIYDDPHDSPAIIAIYSRGGLVIWRAESSIRRALLDGTEVKLLAKVAARNLAVDEKTSLVYWTDENKGEIFQCDLQGQNRRRLKLSAYLYSSLQAFAVLDNILFWQDSTGDSFAVYRTDVRKPKAQLVYNGDVLDIAILPGRVALDDSIENPCENNSCSHVCVQSNSPVGHTCLCPGDFALDRDGHNCSFVRRHLFVSTRMEGIWQIPAPNVTAKLGQAEPKLVVKNAPNATDVQCDPARRKIFWAEGNSKVTKILQLDMENPEKNSKIVFEHSVTLRVTHEELGAFAVDWITGNLYMAFNGERRILACGRSSESRKYSNCFQLFANEVGIIIGGLALDPTHGTVYWAQIEEDPAVIRGTMDGRLMEILWKGGPARNLAIVGHFRVYWVNQDRKQFHYFDLQTKSHESIQSVNYEAYAPQRITFDGLNLYWVGLPKDGSSETIFKEHVYNLDYLERSPGAKYLFLYGKYVDRKFTDVTGLWHCDADLNWTRRKKACGFGRPCAGLCLLSGKDSFRCVCPSGFESPGTNVSSCKEIEEPSIIYSVGGWTEAYIVMKKGMNEKIIYQSWAPSMAFDPVRRELFWFRHVRRVWSATNKAFRLILMKNQSQGTKAAPKSFRFQIKGPRKYAFAPTVNQLEYDWIGENLYYTNKGHGVGLCSTVTGECKVISRWTAIIALDPPNGRMYWMHTAGIGRGEMDGSARTLIIPYIKAHFLTVDHTSKLLFWRTAGVIRGTHEIFHSDLDGKDVRLTIRLYTQGRVIRVAGSRLWMDFSSDERNTRGILSCDKETGDNLKTHEVKPGVTVADFVIQITPAQIPTARDACVQGALCSHICIPTSTGYMRCLCPTGYKLMSDGWTCECRKTCNTSSSDKPSPLRPSPVNHTSKDTPHVVCSGNEFACVGKCLALDKLCNGFPDCEDYSDEGERCNEACKDEHGCSHICSISPAGPVCFCPPKQTLAADNKSCVVLDIRTEKGPAEKLKAGLIVAGVVGVVLVIVIILGTLKYQQTKRQRDLTRKELDEFLHGDPAGASVASDGLEKALSLPFTKIIPLEDIVIAVDAKLGSGEFGIVRPGICRSEPVAVKMLKHSVDMEEFKAVLNEVKIMEYLGDHEFIVKFVGAEISEAAKRKIMIVTELSPKGDLLKYLWKVGSFGLETLPGMLENIAGNPWGVTNLTLYTWCGQIATAMKYLAQKKIVHGDLATRNVLVFRENVVKIADFGLSKQLYDSLTYKMPQELQRKLPWQSSAIELLTSREFSEASDVWAFGVTAWEIFTLGQTPYKGMRNGNELVQFIQTGSRLPQPSHASEEIYNVLLECWDSERSNRPNFHKLKRIFHDFVSEQRRLMQLRVNVASVYVTAV